MAASPPPRSARKSSRSLKRIAGADGSYQLKAVTLIYPERPRPAYLIAEIRSPKSGIRIIAIVGWVPRPTRSDVNDAVDGAHTAASRCHKVVASKSACAP